MTKQTKRQKISYAEILREFIENGGIPFTDSTETSISTAKYLINIGHPDPRLRLSFDNNHEFEDDDLDNFLNFLGDQYRANKKQILLVHFFGMNGEYPIKSLTEDDFKQEVEEIERIESNNMVL